MEKKKKPDLVVWSEEKGYYANQLTYGSNLGAPAISLENVEGWKSSQAFEANKVFNTKFEEIKEEFNRLLEEVYWNDMIYKSQYSFIPIVGEIYHLYKRKDNSIFLSIIEPSSWKLEHVGSFKLNSNKKWSKV